MNKTDPGCFSCTQPGSSNYEIAKRNAGKLFCEYDPALLAQKRNILFKEGYLYPKLLGRAYRICAQTGRVEWSENHFTDCREADFNETMIIYDILCYSRPDAAPSGEFLLMEQLSRIQNASSYAGNGLFQKEEQFLDGKTESLARALQKMHGIPYGKGDVSFRLPVFQSLDIVLSFWESDEDFPAQLQFFCDQNILQYMHYETVWYLASHIVRRIKEIMSGSDAAIRETR